MLFVNVVTFLCFNDEYESECVETQVHIMRLLNSKKFQSVDRCLYSVHPQISQGYNIVQANQHIQRIYQHEPRPM